MLSVQAQPGLVQRSSGHEENSQRPDIAMIVHTCQTAFHAFDGCYQLPSPWSTASETVEIDVARDSLCLGRRVGAHGRGDRVGSLRVKLPASRLKLVGKKSLELTYVPMSHSALLFAERLRTST